ncbi:MAG: rod shape-determining protein MreC [Lachnospiraceae bacterium]|jgi:rod shape-determining protein MreC|nr:rod shape-determining protein MreC [Lachnospiraceae bacterium]MEE3461599.1 rod shape-determining protein MreC [Lachnospiraceae bacterium]
MKLNRKTKMVIDPKYVLAILIVLILIGMFVSFRFREKMVPVRNTVISVVAPMQKGINNVGIWIAGKMDYLHSKSDLVTENKSLKKELKELKAQNRLMEQDKYELKNFRELYDLDEQYASYPKVAARVISSEPDNWYNSFVIDKGSSQGIKKNMNVIAGTGLVGIVTEVNNNYSRVRSIIDDDSNVSAVFLKSKENCIVSGNLNDMNKGVIDIGQVASDAKIDDGAEVVTSQISDRYLPGILIGYAKDMNKDASALSVTGYLTPAVDFKSLDMVLVITQLKETEDLESMLSGNEQD